MKPTYSRDQVGGYSTGACHCRVGRELQLSVCRGECTTGRASVRREKELRVGDFVRKAYGHASISLKRSGGFGVDLERRANRKNSVSGPRELVTAVGLRAGGTRCIPREVQTGKSSLEDSNGAGRDRGLKCICETEYP